MASSGGGGKSVTRVEPPSYQLPHLQASLDVARNQFNTGGPQQYQGNTVVPFAPQTEQALGLQEQRALQGSPVTQAGQGYVQNTLQGGFLNNNPYLDATFNKAALATQNQLASEFARSGRNVDASQGLRSDQLNDLATSIYGGAYDAERNRMNQVLPFVSNLANQDYLDIAQLRGVGSEVEGMTGRVIDDQRQRWDYEQNRPEMALDNYIRRITGNMGQTQTTNQQQSSGARAGGAIGGALTGAQLGSFLGPWGTILGGLGGGLLGWG